MHLNKKNLADRFDFFWEFIALFSAAFIYIPIILANPLSRDSGVFAYGGQILLRGGNPYVDFWDHKGPLIYAFNSVGLFLFGSTRGVYIFEFLFYLTFILLSAKILKKYMRKNLFYFSLLISNITYLLIIQGANFSETWSFGPHILIYSILFILYFSKKLPEIKSLIILINLQILMLFTIILLRPNNAIGPLIATLMCIFKIIKNQQKLKFFSISIMITISSCVTLIILYFYLTESLNEFYEQYFLYNFYYSKEISLNSKITNLLFLTTKILKMPIFISFILLLTVSIIKKKTLNHKIISIFVFLFVIDFISAAISGKPYLHYLILVIPSLLFMNISILIHAFKIVLTSSIIRKVLYIFLATSIFLLSINSRWYKNHILDSYTNRDSSLFKVSTFLKLNTESNDYVYVFGASTKYLVEPFRRSSSFITYLYPIINETPLAGKYALQLTRDVATFKPEYIIQMKNYCLNNSEECKDKYNNRLDSFIENILLEYQPYLTINEGVIIWGKKLNIESP
jgi:hypothetical protein